MNEAQEVLGQVIVSHLNSPVILQPGKATLDLPSFTVSSQGPAILSFGFLPVAFMRRNHFDTPGFQSFI